MEGHFRSLVQLQPGLPLLDAECAFRRNRKALLPEDRSIDGDSDVGLGGLRCAQLEVPDPQFECVAGQDVPEHGGAGGDVAAAQGVDEEGGLESEKLGTPGQRITVRF